jgi:LPXTG-motif cell wall-anchored protein
VQWSRGGTEIANGQYSLASGVEIELTVVPKAPHGFAPEQQTSWTVSFKAASGPCDLTTLSLPNTGGGIAGGALWLGLMTLSLGAAAVVVASRRAAAKQ